MHPTVVKDSVHFGIDDTNFPWTVTISYEGEELCSSSEKFGDGGVYTLNILQTNTEPVTFDCKYFPTTEPSDFWAPVWQWFVVLIVLLVLAMCIAVVNKRYPGLREGILQKLGMWNPEDEVGVSYYLLLCDSFCLLAGYLTGMFQDATSHNA